MSERVAEQATAGTATAGGTASGPAMDDTDLVRIETCITAMFRRFKQRAVREHFGAGGAGLDQAAYGVLIFAGQCGPVRLSDLAGRLGLDVSTTSRHVQQLERDGLMRRADDPADRRASLLHLTDGGDALLDRVRTARRAAIAQMMGTWDPADRHQFADLLSRFVDGLDEAIGAPSRPCPAPGHGPDAPGG